MLSTKRRTLPVHAHLSRLQRRKGETRRARGAGRSRVWVADTNAVRLESLRGPLTFLIVVRFAFGVKLRRGSEVKNPAAQAYSTKACLGRAGHRSPAALFPVQETDSGSPGRTCAQQVPVGANDLPGDADKPPVSVRRRRTQETRARAGGEF